MSRRYKMLAIDVDGTMLGADHNVPPDNARAIRLAAQAGLIVCIATGRSYKETIDIWRHLDLPRPHYPMILVGGSLVSEPDGGRTLYQKTIPVDLACRYSDELASAGYSAAAIFDVWRHGFDYVLVESNDAHDIQDRWFAKMDVKLIRTKHMADVVSVPNPLRINAVVDARNGGDLLARMQEKFGQELEIHQILAPNYGVWIVEAFARGANKWTGLRYVSQSMLISPEDIVAVGDDVNDIPMLSAAGLGVAMPRAPDKVKAVAAEIATCGLADFIHKLLEGRYDNFRRGGAA